MPLFHHKSKEEKEQEEEAQRRFAESQAQQQASLESLSLGGIPVQAKKRLEELRRQEGTFFTSDLSVGEFLLVKQRGLRPLTQVMGSSIYHVGWQYMPQTMWSRSSEMDVISGAYNHSRELALSRLEEEARLAGADAVVGVHLTRGRYEWGHDLIEFSAIGTAVKMGDRPPSERPALTNLSGQDFWKLYSAGYWPLGVVAGTTVYYVVAGWQTQTANSYWGRFYNQELQDFTQGVQIARHRAMGRLHQQSDVLRATGIVGMEIEQEQEEREVNLGNDQERTDMIVTFHAMGTAIAPLREASAYPSVYSTIDLRG
jgi:uncharacterized protein YbjQ (UPF0145 family)